MADVAAMRIKSRSCAIKRSTVITLVLLGSSLAAGAYGVSQQKRCGADNPARPADCRSSGGGGSGGYAGNNSRSGQTAQKTATRGGFGATGSAFSGGHGAGS
jgi:hypothetical protein